jgi:hypothetical protein
MSLFSASIADYFVTTFALGRQPTAFSTLNRCACAGAPLKHCEIIADNLRKAGWSLGCISSTDQVADNSGLPSQSAMVPDVLLREPMKSWLRFWNSNRRFALAANCA